jgi:hypothetical protein
MSVYTTIELIPDKIFNSEYGFHYGSRINEDTEVYGYDSSGKPLTGKVYRVVYNVDEKIIVILSTHKFYLISPMENCRCHPVLMFKHVKTTAIIVLILSILRWFFL